MNNIKGKAAAGLLVTTFMAGGLTGCGSLPQMPEYNGDRKTNTILGGAAGYGLVSIFSKSNTAPVIGAVVGAALANGMSNPCEGETKTNIKRSVNGQSQGQWKGQQQYTETCRSSGKPGDHNMPSYVHNGNDRANSNPNVASWTAPPLRTQYLHDKDEGRSYPVIDQVFDKYNNMTYPVVQGTNDKTCVATRSQHGGYDFYEIEYKGHASYNTTNVPMNKCGS